ncbi:MAG TPA: divalent-cation tolerance protein CutA [Pirellulales bacterium]|nr:divalent-cation tolerance protein CutA [Pirellulales bacterium]
MTDILQVVTTTASKEEAERIARAVVNRRLAACVQISGPISSVYHWQGNVETSQEWQCTFKTRKPHYRELETAIRQLHSYDVPEILAVEVCDGSQDYFDWLCGELADLSGPEIA